MSRPDRPTLPLVEPTAAAPKLEPSRFVDAVIATLPGGVLVLDERGVVLHANEAAGQVLQVPARRLVGRVLGEVRGELSAMMWPADKAEVLLWPETGGDGTLDTAQVLGFSSRRLDGASVGHGGVVTVVSFRDITVQKAQARRESHRQRLADLGKLVSTIAHEIRNPMAAIVSLTQVMATEPAVKADGELSEITTKILAEARRVGRLVDDLLAFGSERPLRKQKVHVVDLMRELVDDLRHLGAEVAGGVREGSGLRPLPMPLQLVVDPTVAAGPYWDLDPDAMRRVIANLVRNAQQAVLRKLPRQPHEGVRVRLRRGPDWLEIDVIDDGVGIPSETLPRVFDTFFTTRPGGTGLGLAIADRLVRAHRGAITLDSRPGQGTVASVRLQA
jgi:two-component system sensor histidine kinase AtoS